MMRKLHLASLALIILLMALSNVALSSPSHISQNLTPILTVPAGIIDSLSSTEVIQAITPIPAKTKTVPLVKQAGNSDRIVLIGILVFGIIVVPMLLKRKEWLGQ